MIVSLISSLQRRSSFKPFWRGDLFIFFVFLPFILIYFYSCFFKPFWQTASQLFFCHINFPLVLRIFPSTAIFKSQIFLTPFLSFREAELSPAQREELLRQLSQWPTKQVQLVVTFCCSLVFLFFFGENQWDILFCFFPSLHLFCCIFALLETCEWQDMESIIIS